MNITGGQVTFKRNFQPEQYGSKGAEVTIMFVMGDGEELGSSLDKIGELVKAKVYELCNLKIEGKPITTPNDVKAADTLPASDNLGGTPKSGTKEAAAANMTAAEKRAATNAAKKAAEAAAEAAKAAKPAETAKVDATDELGDVFDETDPGTAPEVTDADLSAANNRAVARLKEKHAGGAPQLIRTLIATFVEPPKKTHDIPQNLRAQYLKKLEALV